MVIKNLLLTAASSKYFNMMNNYQLSLFLTHNWNQILISLFSTKQNKKGEKKEKTNFIQPMFVSSFSQHLLS